MNDFDYDVYLKKRTARGARSRKCGSKTRYVSLPHDHMTRKEWKEKNGPVITYNESELRNPMSYERFKQLPDDVKQRYLDFLYTEYGVSDAAICRMFGIQQPSFWKYRQHHHLIKPDIPKPTPAESKINREHWETFLRTGGLLVLPGVSDGRPETSPFSEEQACKQEIAPNGADASVPEASVVTVSVERPARKMRMSTVTMVFDGEIDPDGVANSLRTILSDNSKGKLKITFTEREEDIFDVI